MSKSKIGNNAKTENYDSFLNAFVVTTYLIRGFCNCVNSIQFELIALTSLSVSYNLLLLLPLPRDEDALHNGEL